MFGCAHPHLCAPSHAAIARRIALPKINPFRQNHTHTQKCTHTHPHKKSYTFGLKIIIAPHTTHGIKGRRCPSALSRLLKKPQLKHNHRTRNTYSHIHTHARLLSARRIAPVHTTPVYVGSAYTRAPVPSTVYALFGGLFENEAAPK